MLPFNRLQKSNTIENLWVYILFLLKKSPQERPIYGWEIPKLIEKEFRFKPGKITPYRVLYLLEKTGFVKSQIKKRRRIYKITKKGVLELKKVKDFYQKLLECLSV